jgi:predicted KAP-like P-loop ATPase
MFRQIYDEYDKTSHPEKAYLNQFEDTLRDWVQRYLQKDSRLVLFIDDLDRCLPEVTLEVLEALKLYLSLDRLVFVVGLDRTVVDGVVCEHYKKNGLGDSKAREYLNKIFQVEVNLAPSEEQMKEFLHYQISDLNSASGGFWDTRTAATTD